MVVKSSNIIRQDDIHIPKGLTIIAVGATYGNNTHINKNPERDSTKKITMATFNQLLYQIVFSTKARKSTLLQPNREKLLNCFAVPFNLIVVETMIKNRTRKLSVCNA